MLARTADNLFWMARYTERAQNLARMVEVACRLAMTPARGEGQEHWRSTLVSAGCEAGYKQKHGHLDATKVIEYLLLDESNGSSVRSCLKAAREAARAVRTATTREMWECVNATWIEIANARPKDIAGEKLPGFLHWVMERSALFQGAMVGSIMRNDTYHFCQAGSYLERADNTARIIDVKYHLLLPNKAVIGGGIDRSQWATILRSVSALRSYKHVYRQGYRATDVAEFLILRPEMPRSIVHCYQHIDFAMSNLAQLYGESTTAQTMARKAVDTLLARDIDAIIGDGLHEFLGQRIAWTNTFGHTLAEAYHFDAAAA